MTAGEPVRVVLRVENLTGEPAELYLRGRDPILDVVVTRPDGSVVWRRLEGEVILAVLRLEVLPPGGVMELEAVWNQRTATGDLVPPGEYLVRGEVLTDGSPLAAPARPLRISP